SSPRRTRTWTTSSRSSTGPACRARWPACAPSASSRGEAAPVRRAGSVSDRRTRLRSLTLPARRLREGAMIEIGPEDARDYLRPLLPPGVVPEVLFADRPNYVFAMSHAPPGARVWKEALLAGEVELALGEYVGSVLGRMHETTARRRPLVEPFRDHAVFVQLR